MKYIPFNIYQILFHLIWDNKLRNALPAPSINKVG